MIAYAFKYDHNFAIKRRISINVLLPFRGLVPRFFFGVSSVLPLVRADSLAEDRPAR